ncbi:DUF4123 domain-containing protein [Halomonas binhaiensis]|uniref:DUF4123 domain-containing protein n=1 Tax=Halomonas binhaiensis TaxID=2562282 RepID=A0A856QNK8_9GAMM|nr:DUF4123 domain-containing protein [Halomonas binhaiensis]QEM81531.2 DUF4123 domain-containing protein [Halomonas binhaiensis]
MTTLARFPEPGRLYRLVDPSDAPARVLSPEALEECGLLRNPFFAEPQQHQLYLQPVNTHADELHRMVAEEHAALPGSRVEPVAFCGWLYSSEPLFRVVAYLERQFRVISPAGRNCLLRFQDPRVLERLEDILDAEQLSRLLWPIDSWCYFDHLGKLRELLPHREKRRAGKLQLTEKQWQAIKRIERVNKVLDNWNSLKPAPPHAASPADVDRMLEYAEQAGINTGADTNLFAMQGLFYGAGFHRHPIIQAMLRKVARGESYRMQARQLTQNDWDVITRDVKGVD